MRDDSIIYWIPVITRGARSGRYLPITEVDGTMVMIAVDLTEPTDSRDLPEVYIKIENHV